MSKFFINRPIVAMVISIIMVIVGLVTLLGLPIAQFPKVVPPEIFIQANYVGADAQTIEQSVATPIEQQMSGVDNMNYMYSINANNGLMRMFVNFDLATDPNIDHVLTQLRYAQAESQLPADVRNYGVTVQKSLSAPLVLISLNSPKGTRNAEFLANYAYINLSDPLSRAYGISQVQIFGAGQYAMRIWVKPDQLAKLNITVPEIISAVNAQNTVNPAGKLGGRPSPPGQEFTYTVRAQGRLVSEDEFANIVVRATPDGSIVRLKDVARIELGAADYDIVGRFNEKPSAILALYQLPGSNAIEAAKAVDRLMTELKQRFAISVLISAFNALTLSPALSALLLRPKGKSTGPLGRFFDGFNRMYGRLTNGYVGTCRALIHKSSFSILFLVLIALGACIFGKELPTGFLPEEDQGYLYVNVQLPFAASLDRTVAICKQVEEMTLSTPGVKSCTTVAGFSFLSFSRNTYSASIWVALKDWNERTKPEERYEAIKAQLSKKLSRLPGAIAFAFPPPAIQGVGTAGGFTFVLEDRAGKDIPFLAANVSKFMEAARKRPEIGSLNTTFLPIVPQLYVNVDRDKALKEGVELPEVYKTLQTFMGGYFIDYFNRFGRQWQVYVQAEGDYRTRAENLGLFYVRNHGGEAVPLAALTSTKAISGPEFTMRYNLYRSAQINGSAAPGYSSAQANKALEEVFAQTMPPEMGYDYLGISFQEKKAAQGVPPAAIFGLSFLFVFLILAALYESWSLPFSVLLSPPMAVFGAFVALWSRHMVNNIFAQIGLVMLIGLAAKNAILIVEFARLEYEKGKPLMEAALTGARTRLRPILMTSFAFILGTLPLAIASGSGAVARRIIGTIVIGGMLAATCIAVCLIPVTFYVVERLARTREKQEPTSGAETPAEGTV